MEDLMEDFNKDGEKLINGIAEVSAMNNIGIDEMFTNLGILLLSKTRDRASTFNRKSMALVSVNMDEADSDIQGTKLGTEVGSKKKKSKCC